MYNKMRKEKAPSQTQFSSSGIFPQKCITIHLVKPVITFRICTASSIQNNPVSPLLFARRMDRSQHVFSLTLSIEHCMCVPLIWRVSVTFLLFCISYILGRKTKIETRTAFIVFKQYASHKPHDANVESVFSLAWSHFRGLRKGARSLRFDNSLFSLFFFYQRKKGTIFIFWWIMTETAQLRQLRSVEVGGRNEGKRG